MRLKLPNDMKGLTFDDVSSIEMNDFSVEMLLPALFLMVRTQGRRMGRTPNEPTHFEVYLSKLLQAGVLRGFDDRNRQHLLALWLRTSVVKMGRRSLRRNEEQIMHLYPLTMLTHKAGWPQENSRLRGVHLFLYEALKEEAGSPRELEEVFRRAFGEGVAWVDRGPHFDGQFDGRSELDIETLLSVRFLEALVAVEPARAQAAGPERGRRALLPERSSQMARHILRLVGHCRGLVPTAYLTRMLMAVINCHLLVYTLELVRTVSWLVDQKTDEPEELYLDCTEGGDAYSDELARRCVERDLEGLERYTRALLTLRTLHRYVKHSVELKGRVPRLESDVHGYLKGLVGLAADTTCEAHANVEFALVCGENGVDNVDRDGEGHEGSETAVWLRQLREDRERRPVERIVHVLYEAQRQSGLMNFTKWYYSVGGFNRPAGIVAGNTRGARRVARYRMSNELLGALVHVAMADLEDSAGVLPLRKFLGWLERSFGFCIGRPPGFDRSTEAYGAAGQNFEAFRGKLRQIGVFRDLSDGFDAQYLRLPSVAGGA